VDHAGEVVCAGSPVPTAKRVEGRPIDARWIAGVDVKALSWL
jgi:hypothetical protein